MIVIIAVYFGPFKNFPLWIQSCAANNNIDFLLVTDQMVSTHPTNMRVLSMTLGEFRDLATKKLGFGVAIHQSYKCCDLKPAYGLILQDYISEYEYWGHCDMDLIWGDLTGFLQKYNYQRYDKFLFLGHLSLYRNTTEINQAFQLDGSLVGNYKTVFSSDRNFGFDELAGVYSIFQKHNLSIFDKKIFADISCIYHRFRLADGCMTRGEKAINYDQQIFYYSNGKTFRTFFSNNHWQTEELMYVHFQKRPDFPVSFDPNCTHEYYITPKGFIPKKEDDKWEEIIYRYNRKPPFFVETIELIIFTIKLKFGNFIVKLRNHKQ